MANRLFEQLNRMPGSPASMVQQIKNAQNPNAMLMSMANKNPAIANIIREVQQNGGDAKSLFYKKAQQMGVDPNSILSQIK